MLLTARSGDSISDVPLLSDDAALSIIVNKAKRSRFMFPDLRTAFSFSDRMQSEQTLGYIPEITFGIGNGRQTAKETRSKKKKRKKNHFLID